MTKNVKRIEYHFDMLVPEYGKADTVAGEIVRAINKLVYRWYNDGDKINEGYGKETCNPPARFLMAKCPQDIKDKISGLWMFYSSLDEDYEEELDELVGMVMDYLDANPALKETPNNEDMLDYARPEDKDDDDEEDEDDWDEED